VSGDAGPAQALRQLLLVTRRELAVRVRGTAFRVSTIILLIVTAAGIAIPAKLIGGPQHFTVAVAARRRRLWQPRCAPTPRRPGFRSKSCPRLTGRPQPGWSSKAVPAPRLRPAARSSGRQAPTPP
jgi:hypothetical protein